MQLQYLIFDASDEESGHASFDAMASVLADRLPALAGEVETVLRWANTAFGPAASDGEDAEWDYALQATLESHAPLDVAFDARTGHVVVSPADPQGRLTLSLTLSGSASFCDAFREAFAEAG